MFYHAIDTDCYPWSKLELQDSCLREEVLNEWNKLLSQELPEIEYHNFLAMHAGLFLCDGELKLLAVSKLRLGADYVIDFAVPQENYSRGLIWNLIEIESPQSQPFNKKGQPSARLMGAVQQIHDWKRWIIDNRREAEKIFPANGIRTERKPNFKYTIFIGKREGSTSLLSKRNQLSDELGIEIRSFDFLSNCLANRTFHNKIKIFSAEADRLNKTVRNSLVNPFSEAFTDSSWRELLKSTEADGRHFLAEASDAIIFYRKNNCKLMEKFKKELTIGST